ncbi:MAG: type II toxin-antitoxin system HicB family antitoxin [Nitrospirota bacterium]
MLIKIDTYFDGENWCARGVSEDIFTQGETYDELLKNIKEAVSLHLEDELKKGKSAEILVMSEIEVSGVA